MSVRAPLREAADSLAKASTPEPFSASRTSNWVARAGGLPPYIQHIAHDLMEKRGKTESNAIQMAIGIVKNWASGRGKVDANTRAAAAKAVAEWEAKKAGTKAKAVAESIEPTLADLLAVRVAALGRLVVVERQLGTGGIERLLDHESLQEAAVARFDPELRSCASAAGEMSRHELHHEGQMVGSIARRRGLRGEGDRYVARGVNGVAVGGQYDNPLRSKDEAIKAVQTHLSEAPARVISLPTAGKYLVAQPSTYGETTYREFPNEQSARHAAGLPPNPTLPERSSQVAKLGEMVCFDLTTLSGEDIPPLARAQEARRQVPLAEIFDPGKHPHGFHGYFTHSSAPKSMAALATPRHASRPRVRSGSFQRYEGGVTRASAKARAAHAAKPQIPPKELKNVTAHRNAPSRSAWGPGAAKVGKTLLAQKEMDGDKLRSEIKAGRALDTEQAHVARDASGKPLKDAGGRHIYSKERQRLHELIVSALLQGKGVHDKPQAHFTAGGPASGKSGLVKTGEAKFEKLIGKESMIDLPRDVVHLDPDTVRSMLPEYKALVKAGRSDASTLTHEEASHITKVATKIALGRHHHVLIDSVGDSEPGKFAGKIRAAQRAGYGVHVHYATTDIKTALARAEERRRSTGRAVPEQYLRDSHRAVSQRFAAEISKMPGIHLRVVDTTDRPNQVIAERKPGADNIVIRNGDLFRKFLAKGKG